MKKMKNVIVYYFAFIYFELIFRLFCTEKFMNINFINTLIYLIPISFILGIITSFFKEKINKIISNIILFLLTLLYATCTIYKLKFGVFFSLSSLGLANQLTSFMMDTLKTIVANIIPLFLLFIPFIISMIFNKFIDYKKTGYKKTLIYLCVVIFGSIFFHLSLFINKNQNYSLYKLYYNDYNHALTVEKMGVMPSTLSELRNKVFNIDESRIIGEEMVQEFVEPEKEIEYNQLDFNFDNKSNDKIIQTLNEYFKNELVTEKNEYTGKYKNKNLILFMAESFNSFAVSKELTPTLYKLSNEGFVFENFYSPVILSTIGGEFQELTGLYPNLNLLSKVWRKGTNYYPYGFGNVFNNINYNTYAYHNNSYNFQNRDNYLKSLGFNNYLGCRNGLEKRINCKLWPQSDVEMINSTIDDYINSDKPFMTYYVTVSGHMSYNWGNDMSYKHKKEVQHLPYSEPVKAYIATQIELDQALASLIEKLDQAGKLDDTVIALVGDHYPYDLSIEQINEASSYQRDSIIEINRSNFILWNNQTTTTHISKVGSQIDVLPTILNLFDIKYDSRLIAGKDILSNTEGLAIFSNNSWVSDQGKYFSLKNEFIPNDGYEINEEYINSINKLVKNRINISKYIIEKDYYKYVYNNLLK